MRIPLLIAFTFLATLAASGPARLAAATPTSPLPSLGLPAEGKWNFHNGPEYPGAKGKVTLAANTDPALADDPLVQTLATLSYDFTNGGRYVAAHTPTDIPDGTEEIRVRVTSAAAGPVSIRITDATGQTLTLQTAYTQEGEWQTLRFPLTGKIKNHFGGKNDGNIHFPIKKLALLVHKGGRATPAGSLTFTKFTLL
ncbi:hypothetical protein OPIT5_17065 [Opitutaceae bacterium TAV5]|nr:hypothetical protein OPIT5_17065 [Opitutaceae bacterium TAV5]